MIARARISTVIVLSPFGSTGLIVDPSHSTMSTTMFAGSTVPSSKHRPIPSRMLTPCLTPPSPKESAERENGRNGGAAGGGGIR